MDPVNRFQGESEPQGSLLCHRGGSRGGSLVGRVTGEEAEKAGTGGGGRGTSQGQRQIPLSR